MSSFITKDHALRIAHKLGAVIEPGRQQDLAKIYHGGKLIAQYGIRRGSKRDIPRSYVLAQLHVSKTDC